MPLKYVIAGTALNAQSGDNCFIFGLSSDTKPTISDGMTFVEEDTGKVYRREAGVWVEKLNSSYTVPAALAAHEADTTAIHGIADTSLLDTIALRNTAISNHEADTTAVHGIADTSLLDTVALRNTAIANHESDTTSVHGIADTAALALLASPVFTGSPTVPDEAYGVGWNASLGIPTKNAVYDKIETLGAGTVGVLRAPTASIDVAADYSVVISHYYDISTTVYVDVAATATMEIL